MILKRFVSESLLRQIKLRILYPFKEFDFYLSKKEDVSTFKTVCLILGPYRNMTTWVSSVLYLHPNCQVLNHGFAAVINTKCDFIKYPKVPVLDDFLRFASRLSMRKLSGIGGSIIHAHAFKTNKDLENSFRKIDKSKPDRGFESMVWKESHRIMNYLKESRFELQNLFEEDHRLRILYPIRDPLDCATSNINTSHWRHFKNLKQQPNKLKVVELILLNIKWVLELSHLYPDRIFFFFEHEVHSEKFEELSKFLRLSEHLEWLNMAKSLNFNPRKYEHTKEEVLTYRKMVMTYFDNHQEVKQKLLSYPC